MDSNWPVRGGHVCFPCDEKSSVAKHGGAEQIPLVERLDFPALAGGRPNCSKRVATACFKVDVTTRPY